MKSKFLALLLSITTFSFGQTAEDLFKTGDTRVSWLGIDFSHVKLIGCFSAFAGYGDKNARQIKHDYFPAWNELILNEREKYDIGGMLRKDDIYYDVDMIAAINEKAELAEMESYNTPHYSAEEISGFVKQYNTEGKSGIGIALIAETLNKAENEAYLHFVAINMQTKEVLIHERLRGEPGGFGVRNYWAGAIHDVLGKIERNHYRIWRSEFLNHQ